jgi:hypothetical protein
MYKGRKGGELARNKLGLRTLTIRFLPTNAYKWGKAFMGKLAIPYTGCTTELISKEA